MGGKTERSRDAKRGCEGWGVVMHVRRLVEGTCHMYLVALGCSISEDYVNNTWCVCVRGWRWRGRVKRKSEYVYFLFKIII